MSKQTLLFTSLRGIALFTKQANGRFLLNTCNLTLTGDLSNDLVTEAIITYGATLLENTNCGYSYDPVVSETTSL